MGGEVDPPTPLPPRAYATGSFGHEISAWKQILMMVEILPFWSTLFCLLHTKLFYNFWILCLQASVGNHFSRLNSIRSSLSYRCSRILRYNIVRYHSYLQPRGVPRNLKRGGRNFLFPLPLKISVKTKKKKNFTSSNVQFTPQNQLKKKKGHRVLRCPVSTVPLTGDIYQLIYQRGGARTQPTWVRPCNPW